jgi:DNA replication protein DnaC
MTITTSLQQENERKHQQDVQQYLQKMREKFDAGQSSQEYPARRQDANSSCQKCGGLGWTFFEKYHRWCLCQCTEDRKLAAQEKALSVAKRTALANIGLAEADLTLSWAAIKPGYSDGIKAVEAVRPAYERGYGMVFLWGTYGQAKTVIGKILVSLAYRSGKTAAYANFLEALDNIRQAFDAQENKTTELIRRMDWWTGRDVLFLDEFDKCNDTPWAVERKFQIVDRCYQRAIREEALTVIASNTADDELDGYIRSRLQDHRVGPVVHLHGPDGRQSMPQGWKH